MWLVGLASAFGIKLSSSIDDVVWLAPFLTANQQSQTLMTHSMIYTGVCLVQTVVAMVIAYSGRAAVKAMTGGNKDAWSTEKILTVAAGSMLTLYSIKLTYDYIQEQNEGGEGEGENQQTDFNPEAGTYSQVAQEDYMEAYESDRPNGFCTCCAKQEPNSGASEQLPFSTKDRMDGMEIDSPDKGEEEMAKADKDRAQTLFVIAFIGSVDDLTLFVPMLVGKGFDLVQLMLGAFSAAAVIVLLCVFIGKCKPIADALSSIPLAAIVIVFATILMLKAFVFPEGEKGSDSSDAEVTTTAVAMMVTTQMQQLIQSTTPSLQQTLASLIPTTTLPGFVAT
jgi:cadmium resistance protein CadD (predicted permease)